MRRGIGVIVVMAMLTTAVLGFLAEGVLFADFLSHDACLDSGGVWRDGVCDHGADRR